MSNTRDAILGIIREQTTLQREANEPMRFEVTTIDPDDLTGLDMVAIASYAENIGCHLMIEGIVPGPTESPRLTFRTIPYQDLEALQVD